MKIQSCTDSVLSLINKEIVCLLAYGPNIVLFLCLKGSPSVMKSALFIFSSGTKMVPDGGSIKSCHSDDVMCYLVFLA